jgi:outer membrane protein assembly factor BamA
MFHIAHYALLWTLLFAPQQLPQTTNQTIKIESIEFKADAGLEEIDPKRMERSLTRRHWDDDWVEELEARVVDAWQQHGYYLATADISTRLLGKKPEERRYAVIATVHAGKQYRLGEISFEHPRQFTAEELRSAFSIETGDIFNTELIRSGLGSLREEYESRGFIKFTAVPDTRIDEAHGRIDLAIDITEGAQFRISEIQVFGLNPELVEKLQHASFKPGDIYRPSAVEDFFRDNEKALPQGALAADDVARTIDEQKNTVSLVFKFPPCTPRCN